MTGNSRVLAITAPGCRAQWARSRRVMTQASVTAHPSREQIVRGITGVTVMACLPPRAGWRTLRRCRQVAAGRQMQERFIQGGPADGDVFCRDVFVLQRA